MRQLARPIQCGRIIWCYPPLLHPESIHQRSNFDAAILLLLQVDVAAWRAEVERLGPQLARIHIPAATAAQPGLTQEWLSRWQSTKQLQQQMAGLVQQVSSSLPHVQQQVAGDVERLGQTEDRLNRQLAESLGDCKLGLHYTPCLWLHAHTGRFRESDVRAERCPTARRGGNLLMCCSWPQHNAACGVGKNLLIEALLHLLPPYQPSVDTTIVSSSTWPC